MEPKADSFEKKKTTTIKLLNSNQTDQRKKIR